MALTTALALASPVVGSAQRVSRPATDSTATEIPAVARQVYEGTMSPFCPELLLANCPSPQADSLRRAVAARALAGESRVHIEADLRATYGEVVRAAPRSDGFGLVAWIAPFGALLAAGGWVTTWVGRRSGRSPARDTTLGDGPADPARALASPDAATPATAPRHPTHAAGAPDERLAPERDASPEELVRLERLLRAG